MLPTGIHGLIPSPLLVQPPPPPPVLSVVLQGLVVWHLHVPGALSYPPPAILPTRVGPVTNVFACQGTHTEEVVQVVDALATAQERVVLVFQGPGSSPSAKRYGTCAGMQWVLCAWSCLGLSHTMHPWDSMIWTCNMTTECSLWRLRAPAFVEEGAGSGITTEDTSDEKAKAMR